jgi:hypothetical protein
MQDSQREIFHRYPGISRFTTPGNDSLVWFQILYCMLAKYPGVLDSQGCLSLLGSMAANLSLLQEFRESQAWILLILRRLLFIEEQPLRAGLGRPASEPPDSQGSQVRKTPSWPRSWANFKPFLAVFPQ